MSSGRPLDASYREENVDLVREGCANLVRHIENVHKFGVPVVVAVNRFGTDTDAEIAVIQQIALEAGEHLMSSGIYEGLY